MNNEQLTINNELRKKSFKLLFILFFVLTVINCDMFGIQKLKHPAGMGILSLSIAGENAQSRAIMPKPENNTAFASYKLDFKTGDTIVHSEETADLTSLFVPAGTYKVEVTAYKNAYCTYQAAQGTIPSIVILPNAVTTGEIVLYPIATGTGNGTFSWNISFQTIEWAYMEIENQAGTAAYSEICILTGTPPVTGTNKGINSSIDMPAGDYRIAFILKKDAATRTVTWRETLHIFPNLTSEYQYAFTNAHFASNFYDVTLYFNGGNDTDGTTTHWHGVTDYAPVNPTKAGYIFEGWYENPSFSGAKVGTSSSMPALTRPLTLYAKWEDEPSVPLWTGTATATFSFRNTDLLRFQAATTNYGYYTQTIKGSWKMIGYMVSGSIVLNADHTFNANLNSISNGGETVVSASGIGTLTIFGLSGNPPPHLTHISAARWYEVTFDLLTDKDIEAVIIIGGIEFRFSRDNPHGYCYGAANQVNQHTARFEGDLETAYYLEENTQIYHAIFESENSRIYWQDEESGLYLWDMDTTPQRMYQFNIPVMNYGDIIPNSTIILHTGNPADTFINTGNGPDVEQTNVNYNNYERLIIQRVLNLIDNEGHNTEIGTATIQLSTPNSSAIINTSNGDISSVTFTITYNLDPEFASYVNSYTVTGAEPKGENIFEMTSTLTGNIFINTVFNFNP